MSVNSNRSRLVPLLAAVAIVIAILIFALSPSAVSFTPPAGAGKQIKEVAGARFLSFDDRTDLDQVNFEAVRSIDRELGSIVAGDSINLIEITSKELLVLVWAASGKPNDVQPLTNDVQSSSRSSHFFRNAFGYASPSGPSNRTTSHPWMLTPPSFRHKQHLATDARVDFYVATSPFPRDAATRQRATALIDAALPQADPIFHGEAMIALMIGCESTKPTWIDWLRKAASPTWAERANDVDRWGEPIAESELRKQSEKVTQLAAAAVPWLTDFNEGLDLVLATPGALNEMMAMQDHRIFGEAEFKRIQAFHDSLSTQKRKEIRTWLSRVRASHAFGQIIAGASDETFEDPPKTWRAMYDWLRWCRINAERKKQWTDDLAAAIEREGVTSNRTSRLVYFLMEVDPARAFAAILDMLAEKPDLAWPVEREATLYRHPLFPEIAYSAHRIHTQQGREPVPTNVVDWFSIVKANEARIRKITSTTTTDAPCRKSFDLLVALLDKAASSN